MSHHAEVFFGDDESWGWQCFEPDCREEVTGFEDIDSAESDADLHALETS